MHVHSRKILGFAKIYLVVLHLTFLPAFSLALIKISPNIVIGFPLHSDFARSTLRVESSVFAMLCTTGKPLL